MGRPVKVALVGAGSAQFSLALLRDLVLCDLEWQHCDAHGHRP